MAFFFFTFSLSRQSNDEQKAYWLPKVENWEIIGCYGQTELGHGSNVRGIECEARWNPDTKDFTIHSPTLTASKWWNGALGRTANHAIVVAQLMLPDKKTGKLRSHGPHQFIVQIRDMKTHEPLENIHVGDIGPKFGYNTMDNGFLLFNKVKIPHQNIVIFSDMEEKVGERRVAGAGGEIEVEKLEGRGTGEGAKEGREGGDVAVEPRRPKRQPREACEICR